MTTSRLLMGFLDFYSNCFNPRMYGVNTINDGSFYPLPVINDWMFVIVDPVNPSNNPTRHSYQTQEILKRFRNAFLNLKTLIQKQY